MADLTFCLWMLKIYNYDRAIHLDPWNWRLIYLLKVLRVYINFFFADFLLKYLWSSFQTQAGRASVCFWAPVHTQWIISGAIQPGRQCHRLPSCFFQIWFDNQSHNQKQEEKQEQELACLQPCSFDMFLICFLGPFVQIVDNTRCKPAVFFWYIAFSGTFWSLITSRELFVSTNWYLWPFTVCGYRLPPPLPYLESLQKN